MVRAQAVSVSVKEIPIEGGVWAGVVSGAFLGVEGAGFTRVADSIDVGTAARLRVC